MGQKQKILVVDDIAEFRSMLKDFIVNICGDEFDIIEAKDGEEATQSISDFNPIIIFSDTNMPKVNGLDLLRWTQKNRPSVPFVLFYSDFNDGEDVHSMGAFKILTKPFSFGEIKEIIERILRGA